MTENVNDISGETKTSADSDSADVQDDDKDGHTWLQLILCHTPSISVILKTQ